MTPSFSLNALRNARNMLKSSPRKPEPHFLPMQIAGASNDDPMGANRRSTDFPFLLTILYPPPHLSTPPSFLSYASSPFGVLFFRDTSRREYSDAKRVRITLLKKNLLRFFIGKERTSITEKNRRVRREINVAALKYKCHDTFALILK